MCWRVFTFVTLITLRVVRVLFDRNSVVFSVSVSLFNASHLFCVVSAQCTVIC